MSMSSYMVQHLRALEEQWSRAVKTLPEHDLTQQRDQLREQAVDVIGRNLPEALVLRVFNGDLRRRRDRELPR